MWANIGGTSDIESVTWGASSMLLTPRSTINCFGRMRRWKLWTKGQVNELQWHKIFIYEYLTTLDVLIRRTEPGPSRSLRGEQQDVQQYATTIPAVSHKFNYQLQWQMLEQRRTLSGLIMSRTPDERPPSPTTTPLIRPHFVWRTVVSVRIRIPHERPSLLYDHTNVILRVVV